MITIEIKAVPELEQDKLNGAKCTFERRFRKEETFRKVMEELKEGKPIRCDGHAYTPLLETLKVAGRKAAEMYCIEFTNPVLNCSDVIGWNMETGEAGVWSGLFGNKAFFILRSDANKFVKILKAKGIETEQMTIIKIQ